MSNPKRRQWRNEAAGAPGPNGASGTPYLSPVTVLQVRGPQRAWLAVPVAHTALPKDTGELSDWLTWVRSNTHPPVFGVGGSPSDAYYAMCQNAGAAGQDFFMAPAPQREQALQHVIGAFLYQHVRWAHMGDAPLPDTAPGQGIDPDMVGFKLDGDLPMEPGQLVVLADPERRVLVQVVPDPEGATDDAGNPRVQLQPVAQVALPAQPQADPDPDSEAPADGTP